MKRMGDLARQGRKEGQVRTRRSIVRSVSCNHLASVSGAVLEGQSRRDEMKVSSLAVRNDLR